MTKILSIGAATQDVFLKSKAFIPVSDGEVLTEQLPLGAKLEVEEVVFGTGGGASNAAVTFARQGLESLFMGSIGSDPAGQAVLAALDADDIDSSHVFQSNYTTGYSVILLAPGGERTILVHRGASAHYLPEDYDISKIDVDWLYLSSFAGQMDVVESIITQASKKGIKIAFNPGKSELKQAEKLRPLLEDLAIIIANKEEMAQLVEGETAEELALHAANLSKYAIVTDGPNGEVAVGDGKVVSGGMYEDIPVLDRTGAGDAFGSGFTAALASGKTVEEAVIFASANSTSVVNNVGAKPGILHANADLHDMPLEIRSLNH